jgi:hypothetical protein
MAISASIIYGNDIFVDLFSAIVLIMICFTAFKFSKLRKRKEYSYLITSLLLLAISFIFKIFTHFSVYLTTSDIIITKNVIFWMLLIHRVLSLIAFYLLYLVFAQKKQSLITIFFLYLLLIIGYVTNTIYYVFHITTFVIMILIIERMYKSFRKHHHKKTKFMIITFTALAISQLLFTFTNRNPLIYGTAEFIQFIGYLLLLLTFKVIKDGTKRKNRHSP